MQRIIPGCRRKQKGEKHSSRNIFGFGRLSGVSYGMSLFSGIMSVILGVLILWIIPMDSTWIVGLLFGIDLFVGGITLLSIFIAIRRIHKRAQNEAVGNRQ